MASADQPPPRPALTPAVAIPVVVLLAALVATSGRYGYHRDELYFIAAGAHPAFGYPDQPPLIPLLCQAMQHLAPGSLLGLRLSSAFAAAATVLVAALIARELDGTTRAQLIATTCTAVSAIALVTGHFVTTTTFDLLTTTVLCWMIIRTVTRHSGPSLLAAGITVGIGTEFKPQVALVATIILVTLTALGPRWPWRSPWLPAAILAAAALTAPYAIWQATHGWPQLTVAAHVAGSAEGGRVGFIPFQLIMVSPLLVPVWIAGLLAPFRRPALRPLRFLPVTYLALGVLYLAGDGKAYYLASLYPALLAVGALPLAAWTRPRITLTQPPAAARGGRTGLMIGAVALSGAASAFIALPLLPATDLRGSVIVAVNPDQAETVGWPDFVHAVDAAWNAIPTVERRHAVIFTRNYGEAGALDLLAKPHSLPTIYSGHNGYSQWGRPPDADTIVLIVGYPSGQAAAPNFIGCSTTGHVENTARLDNQERGQPILLCHTARPWTQMWPALTHFD